MSLREIVKAMGGDLYAGGSRANIPAPGHSAHDRSVSLLLSRGRVVVKTFSSHDSERVTFEVLDKLKELKLIDNDKRLTGSASFTPRTLTVVPSNAAEKGRVIRRLWGEAKPVGPATLAARHIRLRGVEREIPGADVVRYHPEAPISAYETGGKTKPALIVLIQGPDDVLAGLEITYLDPNGRRATGLRLPRKTIGNVPSSSAVRVDAAARRMCVAEGFFTTLSATEFVGLPGWALMSTTNLRTWCPPPIVEELIIGADRNKDGEASAEVLRSRMVRQGLKCDVVLPPEPHGDFNEAGRPA